MFEVKWTGKYPCLCSGKWEIKKNGVDVSNYIPNNLQRSEMNTFGSYSRWNFYGDWEVNWSQYTDGLTCGEWIEKNDWIKKICDNYSEMTELYYAINNHDWRSGSCGGCI